MNNNDKISKKQGRNVKPGTNVKSGINVKSGTNVKPKKTKPIAKEPLENKEEEAKKIKRKEFPNAENYDNYPYKRESSESSISSDPSSINQENFDLYLEKNESKRSLSEEIEAYKNAPINTENNKPIIHQELPKIKSQDSPEGLFIPVNWGEDSEEDHNYYNKKKRAEEKQEQGPRSPKSLYSEEDGVLPPF